MSRLYYVKGFRDADVLRICKQKIKCYTDRQRKDRNHTLNAELLARKMIVFIHCMIKGLIRQRCEWNFKDRLYMNSSVLRDIYGKGDYVTIVDALMNNVCLIKRAPFKRNGDSGKLDDKGKSFQYYFCDKDGKEVFPEYTFKKKVDLTSYIKKGKIQFNESNECVEIPFKKDYLNALSKLRMPYLKHAKEFVKYMPMPPRQKHYYNDILGHYEEEDFVDQGICADKNHRIYSILTNTPRELKVFLNIRFACDIHNSHPLLFCKCIYEYYGLTNNAQYQICQVIDKCTLHCSGKTYNVTYKDKSTDEETTVSVLLNGKLVRNPLEMFGLGELIKKQMDLGSLCVRDRDRVHKIPDDVWSYILLVSWGKFWDVLLACFKEEVNPDMWRQEAKQLMFANVFYAYKGHDDEKNDYSNFFMKSFPTVMEIVQSYRTEYDDGEEKLACRLMRIESDLFWQILIELYKRGFAVLNIHDAIEVLDVPENEGCTVDVVKDVINQVYTSSNLHPDISVDTYNGHLDAIHAVKKAKIINREFNKKLNSLEHTNKAEYDDLYSKFTNGFLEFDLDANKQLVIHVLEEDWKKYWRKKYSKKNPQKEYLESA